MASEMPGAAPETLEASEPGDKRKWTLQLYPDGLRGWPSKRDERRRVERPEREP